MGKITLFENSLIILVFGFLGQGVLVTPNINVFSDTSFLQPVLCELEFSTLTLGG